MADLQLLKKDLFGEICRSRDGDEVVIIRDCTSAATGLRWLARRLLQREARALATLDGLDGIPQVVRIERNRLIRSFIDGEPMQRSRPTDPAYFKAAARLLRHLHRAGVAHNDLAKEPNFIVRADGSPGILDFQLSWCVPQRTATFRLAAREDLRHLLKHKRTYCPAQLTARERAILDNPTLAARAWSRSGKQLYLFVTRRLLGWSDREGAGDRGDRTP